MGLKIIETLKKPIRGFIEMEKELPRFQKFRDTTLTVSKNVERYREHHFDHLMDIGIQHPDERRGIEILEGVSEIAETYGKYRNAPLVKNEILRHVEHIYQLHQMHEPERAFKRSHEAITTLASVAKRMRELEIDEEIIAKALAAARQIDRMHPDRLHKEYVERMNAIERALQENDRKAAAMRLAELLENWRRSDA